MSLPGWCVVACPPLEHREPGCSHRIHPSAVEPFLARTRRNTDYLEAGVAKPIDKTVFERTLHENDMRLFG
jgi:hypothetical protein